MTRYSYNAVVVVVLVLVVDDDDDDYNNEKIMFTDSSKKRVCVTRHIRVTHKLIKLNRITLKTSCPSPCHEGIQGQQR